MAASTTQITDVTKNFDRQAWLDVNCEGCGKQITLYFNGGELDRRECCGRTYTLVAPRIDLVVDGPPVYQNL